MEASSDSSTPSATSSDNVAIKQTVEKLIKKVEEELKNKAMTDVNKAQFYVDALQDYIERMSDQDYTTNTEGLHKEIQESNEALLGGGSVNKLLEKYYNKIH